MTSLPQFLDLIAALRHPQTGCPWDLKQTHESLAKYALEEAYEVVDAIDTGNLTFLKEELGDLLLQIVLHAQLAKEAQAFTFEDVVNAISEKIIRRHPHVFKGDTSIKTAEDQTKSWEQIKAQERKDKDASSVFDSISKSLPSHIRAQKLRKAVDDLGFKFENPHQIIELVRSECDEVEEALKNGDKDHLQEELGDVIFTAILLTNFLKFDADETLRKTNSKLERRYRNVEGLLKEDTRAVKDIPYEDLEKIWIKAKK